MYLGKDVGHLLHFTFTMQTDAYLKGHIDFDKTHDLLKSQYYDLEEKYNNAVTEMAVLRAEKEGAIAELDRFRKLIQKLAGILKSEGLADVTAL